MRAPLLLMLAGLAACRSAPDAPVAAADSTAPAPVPEGAAVGGEAALAQMQGVWGSVADSAASLEVDGVHMIVRDARSDPHGGTVAFVPTCGDRPTDALRRYFVLTEEGTPYCYFLQALTDSVMHLTYVAEGETFAYRRVSGAPRAVETAPVAPLPTGAATGYAVALDPDGLRLVDPAGRTRPVPFGTAQARTVEALAAVLGRPRATGTNPECGAGPLGFATWNDGLTVFFAQEALAGWTVDGRAEEARRFTTFTGVGVGSTRADLSDGYEVRVGPTSLGTEFTTGDLGGLLDGEAPGARITTLWAGATCHAR